MSAASIDQTLEQVGNFLRHHGYQIARDDDQKAIYARHPERLNVMVRIFSQATMLTAVYECNETAKCDRLGYLEFINTLNNKGVVARYYDDKMWGHSAICIEICYIGDYREPEFNRMWEWMEGDIGRMMDSPRFETYFG